MASIKDITQRVAIWAATALAPIGITAFAGNAAAQERQLDGNQQDVNSSVSSVKDKVAQYKANLVADRAAEAEQATRLQTALDEAKRNVLEAEAAVSSASKESKRDREKDKDRAKDTEKNASNALKENTLQAKKREELRAGLDGIYKAAELIADGIRNSASVSMGATASGDSAHVIVNDQRALAMKAVLNAVTDALNRSDGLRQEIKQADKLSDGKYKEYKGYIAFGNELVGFLGKLGRMVGVEDKTPSKERLALAENLARLSLNVRPENDGVKFAQAILGYSELVDRGGDTMHSLTEAKFRLLSTAAVSEGVASKEIGDGLLAIAGTGVQIHLSQEAVENCEQAARMTAQQTARLYNSGQGYPELELAAIRDAALAMTGVGVRGDNLLDRAKVRLAGNLLDFLDNTQQTLEDSEAITDSLGSEIGTRHFQKNAGSALLTGSETREQALKIAGALALAVRSMGLQHESGLSGLIGIVVFDPNNPGPSYKTFHNSLAAMMASNSQVTGELAVQVSNLARNPNIDGDTRKKLEEAAKLLTPIVTAHAGKVAGEILDRIDGAPSGTHADVHLKALKQFPNAKSDSARTAIGLVSAMADSVRDKDLAGTLGNLLEEQHSGINPFGVVPGKVLSVTLDRNKRPPSITEVKEGEQVRAIAAILQDLKTTDKDETGRIVQYADKRREICRNMIEAVGDGMDPVLAMKISNAAVMTKNPYLLNFYNGADGVYLPPGDNADRALRIIGEIDGSSPAGPQGKAALETYKKVLESNKKIGYGQDAAAVIDTVHNFTYKMAFGDPVPLYEDKLRIAETVAASAASGGVTEHGTKAVAAILKTAEGIGQDSFNGYVTVSALQKAAAYAGRAQSAGVAQLYEDICLGLSDIKTGASAAGAQRHAVLTAMLEDANIGPLKARLYDNIRLSAGTEAGITDAYAEVVKAAKTLDPKSSLYQSQLEYLNELYISGKDSKGAAAAARDIANARTQGELDKAAAKHSATKHELIPLSMNGHAPESDAPPARFSGGGKIHRVFPPGEYTIDVKTGETISRPNWSLG